MRLAVALCLFLLAACARPVDPNVTELTYATQYAPSHPFSRADKTWIEHIERASQGRLRIDPFWSGSLFSSDQTLIELRVDCDGDTLLALVDQKGVACHTGRHNCFFRAVREGSLTEIAPIVVDMEKIGKD